MAEPKPRMQCLHKSQNCTSVDCEYIAECTDPQLSTHCFAIIEEIYSTGDEPQTHLIQNQTSMFNFTNRRNQSAKAEIVMAGCWSGSEECHSPVLIENLIKNEKKILTQQNTPFPWSYSSRVFKRTV